MACVESGLFDRIRSLVAAGDYLFTVHARRRLESRRIESWQVVAGLAEADLLEDRPEDMPNPSVVVAQLLPAGTEVRAVWSLLWESNVALLVSVYIPGVWCEPQ